MIIFYSYEYQIYFLEEILGNPFINLQSSSLDEIVSKKINNDVCLYVRSSCVKSNIKSFFKFKVEHAEDFFYV